MRQISFSLGTGEISLVDLPYPTPRPNHVIVAGKNSLMSAGTERMLLDFGKSGWVDKIRQQPDKVREVVDKVRSDGLLTTLDAVRAKLDRPIPIGYSHVGRILEVGAGVSGFAPGDRVVSNGPHAEVVRVPAILCAKIPDSVEDEAASFTVVASIALQSVRLAGPAIGEQFMVIGLGLIGLLSCQILVANGCRVFGCDFDVEKLRLARESGADTFDLNSGADVVSWVMSQTGGRGVDGVLVAASTASNDPMRQAAQMSRKRGRVVLVGVTGLQLSRADFYEKELTFQVSCSYGPGRYDAQYEQDGQDYPYGLVRWTAQRNFETILQLLETRRLNVGSLITHRFDFAQSQQAYEVLGKDRGALGVLLDYAQGLARPDLHKRTVQVAADSLVIVAPATAALAFIGAGNYALRKLVPSFAQAGASLRVLANTGSLQGGYGARRFGFAALTSDVESVFADESIDTVVIATQHDSHAKLAVQALRAGKHVFVEKPLALTLEDLEHVKAAMTQNAALQLCVGFNRRFSPIGSRMREAVERVSGPKSIVYCINAGRIPATHWTQQANAGGGRIVGECCHFIDFLRFLVGAPIVGFDASPLQQANLPRDTATLTLRFADGSVGTIHYFSNGPRSLPKERVEVFADGRALQMENFQRLRGDGWGAAVRSRTWWPDKGQAQMAAQFVQRLQQTGPPLIPFDELWEVATISILAQQAIDTR